MPPLDSSRSSEQKATAPHAPHSPEHLPHQREIEPVSPGEQPYKTAHRLTPKPKPLPHRKSRSWSRNLRYWLYRIMRLQGSPEAIARGLAAGVFSGWFPWFGFQILIAIALATVVRGNRLAAAIATWVSNPFTYLPIFAFNYQVGQWLLPGSNPVTLKPLNSNQELLALSGDILLALALGCVVVGVVVSLTTYGVGRQVIYRVRQNRHRRIQRSKQ